MPTAEGTPRSAAWAAFEAGDWDTAQRAFEEGAAKGDPDALDGLGQVLWFRCEIEAGLRAREAAYAGFRRAGDDARAAHVALWLSVEHLSSWGRAAVAEGWFRRAERLLAGLAPCEAHAELLVQRARRAASTAEADALFEQALALARELGSLDAETRALSQLGLHRVATGRVEEGFALLDEAMAAAMGGELRSPWQIGGAACSMLGVCDQMSDMDRAAQWCRIVLELLADRGYVPLFAWCRTAFAGVLVALGRLDLAEEQARSALQAYGGADRPMAAYALARLAEVRLCQGRLEEAARLIDGHEAHARVAPLAIELAIARGETAAAQAALDRRLAALAPEDPARARWLLLRVEAALGAGDPDAARAATDELQVIARTDARANVVAAAGRAAGRVALAAGEPAATGLLEDALERYLRVGMPLESARTRLDLARALLGEDADRAVAEARRALAAFEEAGARRDADVAAAFLRERTGAGRSAPRLGGELTAREREVLALLGEGLGNAAIAERLVISPKTAEHHVSRVLRKLGLASRAEAAAHAVRAGLAEDRGR